MVWVCRRLAPCYPLRRRLVRAVEGMEASIGKEADAGHFPHGSTGSVNVQSHVRAWD